MKLFWVLFEYIAVLLLGWALRWINTKGYLTGVPFEVLVLGLAALKTVYFILENSRAIIRATAQNVPYHRFMALMAINITQISLSYAVDFYCLYQGDRNSFSGINPNFSPVELMVDFGFFSVLNFSFFGFGDITPATIPAKLTVLMEIVLAYLTVIFILSDFISLKESLRGESWWKKKWKKE